MKKVISLFSKVSIFCFLSTVAFAQEGVIRIPLNTLVKPAGDLISEKGKALSYGALVERYKKYKTLSDLSPAENKYWQDKKFEATDVNLHQQMPSQNETVYFDDYLGAVRELGIFSIYIRPQSNQNIRYGMTFGLQVHSSLLKSALLRKVGYYQESPKYLQSIKLKFKDTEQLNQFINTAFCENGVTEEALDCLSLDAFRRGFLSDKNEKENSVVVHGVYLEKMNSEVPSLFDGLTPATDNNLQYLAQSRAFRGLAVPFVMGDVGESLNRYSPQAVSVRGGWAELNFMNSVYFDLLTGHDDVKWALERYSKLSMKDWDEIIAAGQFPECTQPLVKSLLLHRYKNMIESFFDKATAQNYLSQISIQKIRDINTSCVENGKVTQQNLNGFPQRFSHGPRQSPFETADLIKYMKITTQSAVLQKALDMLNQKLQVTKVLDQQVNGVEVGPSGFKLLTDTSGAMVGVNFNASRIVTTGTYYGSEAKVQLVDNVSIGAGLGYQNIFDGLNGIRRNYGASTSYVRSFTHVMPIENMKQADKTAWFQNLKVKSKLKKLSAPLKDGKLNEFLTSLKVGEVFTITDSIMVSGNLGWNSGLDALFGFVKGLSADLSFNAAKQITLRQVQFSRTREGLQVYVRDIDSHMYDEKGQLKPQHKQSTTVYGVTFDVNYFINIFKLSAQRTKADLHTDAFLIKFNTALISGVNNGEIIPDENNQEQIDKMLELGKKAAAAIRGILFQSDLTGLYTNFKSQQFEIDHSLKIKEIQSKILWQRATSLDQEHKIRILKTDLPKQVDGVDVKNMAIEVISNRKGELRGRDLFGLSLESLNAYLAEKFQGKAPTLQGGGQNPSQMPFGFAQWRVVRTDSEITPEKREGFLPTVSVIEHIWGGWNMKRPQMLKILDEVKNQMKEIKIASFPLIPDGALSNVDKVDFFRVTSHLSLLPEAIDQIKDLILSPEVKGQSVQKAKFLARLFQKLSEVQGKARAEDNVIFNKLLKILGNGDETQGKINYMVQCEMNKRNQNQEVLYTWSRGTGYECLEPWIEKILKLSREFPENDKAAQNRWMTEVLYVLDEQIPQAYLLNYLGQDKFIYYVELTGFRQGDEDGDNGVYLSNSYGEPNKAAPYANGLMNILATKSYISPVEFDKQGSF